MSFSKSLLAIVLVVFFAFSAKSQELPEISQPPFLGYQESEWVDSVFNTLSQEEKIAQLIMVAAYSNRDPQHLQDLLNMVKNQKVGGFIFFQGGPVREGYMINKLQAASKVPLLTAMDAEWGVGMRLDSTMNFPYQMTLGAIQNNGLIYEMGQEIGRQLKRAGINFNFAPVVDVNNNPGNPVINYRSFGSDKYNVAEKGTAYMKGMQSVGILSSAKHFPGHGDTDTDSHYALPLISHSRERLDTLELYPFREIIDAGISSVMVAHLNIPALDPDGNSASTLSKPIITDLLKNDIGFKGIVVTDAMNMKGVTKGNTPGVVDMKAILAGNDLLEFTEDVPKAIEEIKKAIDAGKISQEEIDMRCKKILAAKEWVGLDKFKPLELQEMVNEMNTPTGELLNRKLMGAALTVLNNNQDLMPLKRLDTLKIASVSVGKTKETDFQKMLNLYTGVEVFNLGENSTAAQITAVKSKLKNYNLVIVGVHDTGRRPNNKLGISNELNSFVGEMASSGKAIVSVFKNAYVLDKLKNVKNAEGLIVSYEDNTNAEELAAQLIFGGIGASGKLPVAVNNDFKVGDGLDVTGNIRFNYTLPEDAGMNSQVLYAGIDSLVQEAIDMKATPGCQVLVAKDRKVVFYKSYGLQSYFDTTKVQNTDMYDLASITKVTGALPALMRLYDEGKFNLDGHIDDYMPYFKHSNKTDANFREILAHQAAFKSWIAYWKDTFRKNGSYRWGTLKSDSSARFPYKLADSLYMFKNFKKKIYRAIKKSPLEPEKKYLYSGLAFYLFPEMVADMSGKDFDTYLYDTFYRPLGATTMTFKPMEKFPIERIVPTESDFYFRHQAIHGNVHDEGAIMMKGVSGNAGLFADANDLAKVLEMYVENGTYGGQRYIADSTMEEFTRYQFPENDNRRGLGFDKPNLEYVENGNAAKDASPASYGHTGFTGNMFWVDPKYNLVYVFLSNRVHPTRDNTRLYKLNTRTKIQQVLYDAMEKGNSFGS